MNTQDQCQKIGNRIQSKRTARRLEISEVAQTIKVVEQTIRHIESGDWDKLGARVYAQGQINAYAKLVGVKTDDIAEYFKSLADEETIEQADLIPAHRSVLERIGHPLNKLGYVAATALIAVPATFALIMAFQSRDSQTPIEQVQLDPSASETDATKTTIDPVLASMTPVMKSATQAETGVQQDGFEELNQQIGTEESELNDSIPDSDSSSDRIADFGADGDSQDPNLADGILNLSINDQVWVEISDLDGERLAYGLKSAGWSMTFPLTHGLQVRMGNADAVTATLDGKHYDLSPHTRQDIATFEIPAS